MMERPILFSTEMVRAILGGRKSMTRRVVKGKQLQLLVSGIMRPDEIVAHCPYGQVGDRLWVRETFVIDTSGSPDYRADCDSGVIAWKPSIFMPRWASRITLEITNIKVERLQGIAFQDCIAEGILSLSPELLRAYDEDWEPALRKSETDIDELADDIDREMLHIFMRLWDSINGKTYPWSNNPWVWVIDFVSIKEGKK